MSGRSKRITLCLTVQLLESANLIALDVHMPLTRTKSCTRTGMLVEYLVLSNT